ncbi:TPA: AmmeMemoRadiSam system protein B, partial [Candidatus Gracilibacteria bacterium]|nr:AmmeMemoRadiSam system protein B [Candidatus Gracilibacteria bacterium]
MKQILLISLCISLLSGCFTPVIIEPKNTHITTQEDNHTHTQNIKKITDYKHYIPAKILDKSFYEKAFSVANKKFETKNSQKLQTNLLIVNHHLLAPHFIADTLNQISKKQKKEIKNIILISPNHFNEGGQNIISSDIPFKTPYGFLENMNYNKNKNALNIKIDNTVMKNEHGITGIVGFIHKKFNTKNNTVSILPIIINDKTSISEMENLAKNITNTFSKKDTLVIISSDMSHDLFPSIANFHDITTLQAIQNLDTNSIHHLDTDSKPTFYTLFSIAKIWNQEQFTLTHHSSSAKILEKKYQPDTTSYITGFFTEDKNINKQNQSNNKKIVTGLFFGDMMFDRYIRQQLDKKGWESILDWRMKRFMTGSDFTVVNFEGAMTKNKPYTARDNMMAFTSDPKWAKNMSEYGINIASLANNHSLNFGKQGLSDTKKFLEKYNIATFGTPYNDEKVGNLTTFQ